MDVLSEYEEQKRKTGENVMQKAEKDWIIWQSFAF